MKPLFFLFISSCLLLACQPQTKQYFEDSPEIDNSKKLIEYYHTGDWDAMKASYADTARMYHNTVDFTTIDEAIAGLQASLEFFSEYGFSEGIVFEHVITDAGNEWIGWWGRWSGTLKANGETITTPVHLSQLYVDGKIAEEFGYWDNQPLFAALQAIEDAADGEEGYE